MVKRCKHCGAEFNGWRERYCSSACSKQAKLEYQKNYQRRYYREHYDRCRTYHKTTVKRNPWIHKYGVIAKRCSNPNRGHYTLGNCRFIELSENLKRPKGRYGKSASIKLRESLQ